MSDIDQVVRDALTDRAARVRMEATDPLPGVQRRAARIRHRRTVAAVIPAVAGLSVVAAFTAVVSTRGGAGVRATPADTGSASATASPSPSTPDPSDSSSETASPSAVASTLAPSSRQEALEWGLAVNPTVIYHVTFRKKPQGVLKCGLKVLGEDPAAAVLYAWIGCQDYFLEGGHIKDGAAASLPAVIHVAGRGAETAITEVAIPRDANFVEDIRRMFPRELQDRVITGNIRVDAKPANWPAEAERDLTGEVVDQLPGPAGPGQPDADASAIAARFLTYARGRSDSLPVDTPVRLYLGNAYQKTIRPQQDGRAAWEMCAKHYAARTCPMSPLAALADSPVLPAVTERPTGVCLAAWPDPPEDTGGSRSITLEPHDADCTQQYAVQIWFNDVGQITAVNLLLGEP
jgi:hypothetical protein